jgi:hypothetical protein
LDMVWKVHTKKCPDGISECDVKSHVRSAVA